MKKVNFLGLIQCFLFSKSLFNKGSTKSIHCDSIYSFRTHNPPREKMDNHNTSQLSTGICSSVAGGNTAFKPPRTQRDTNRNGQIVKKYANCLTSEMCLVVTAGTGAYKPPREQSVETTTASDNPAINS
ncbi:MULTISPECIES: hypothetical protein [Pseudoalteromonas]|uniref:hypothetical protein n=1 Tax=Pseudoalteromonas TaxID=53246 RepID=UPI00029B3191|nr:MULTISPECIES: hypothetical protein [Pseudoalteromonas]MBR8845214.1 hypothetical protein [Pseudoalteromonas sp. JC3]QUI71729.1 hypothetical protein GSF13_19185 [Pseudoalteromonas sp. M8]WJE07912.1 hypothetical protein QSH61_13590 [Pseudoalteromonas sp. JC3]